MDVPLKQAVLHIAEGLTRAVLVVAAALRAEPLEHLHAQLRGGAGSAGAEGEQGRRELRGIEVLLSTEVLPSTLLDALGIELAFLVIFAPDSNFAWVVVGSVAVSELALAMRQASRYNFMITVFDVAWHWLCSYRNRRVRNVQPGMKIV